MILNDYVRSINVIIILHFYDLGTILESTTSNGIKIILLLLMSIIIHEYNNSYVHQIIYQNSHTIK